MRMSPLSQHFSPLELLEQRSQSLAARFQETISYDSVKNSRGFLEENIYIQGAQNGNLVDVKPSSLYSTSSNTTNQSSTHDFTDRISQNSVLARNRKSTASFGSILGNFRLSNYSIMENIITDSDKFNLKTQASNSTLVPSSNATLSLNCAIEAKLTSTHQAVNRNSSHVSQEQSMSDHAVPAYHVSGVNNNHNGGRKFSSKKLRGVSLFQITSDNPVSKGAKVRRSIFSKIPSFRRSSVSVRSNCKYQSNDWPSNAEASVSQEKPRLNRLMTLSSRRSLAFKLQSSLFRRSSQSSQSHYKRKSLNKKYQPFRSCSIDHNSFDKLREKSLNNCLTLDERVLLGIMYYEEGNYKESSYHWQNAAYQNDLTAMVLYGLALIYGWGIRQNLKDGAKWLRKVIGPIIDSITLENILKTDLTKDWPNSLLRNKGTFEQEDLESRSDKKVKKDQIALALYELGICYLNSWGVDNDEEMALKCFELAGSLGDIDGLNEAASLWMRSGLKGRKKSIHRAAKLYRSIEEKGGYIVSNSWIYKEKYMTEER